MKFDLVVVGSGVAGLSFALKASEKGKRVAIITKKTSADSNTNHAQGGIACVTADGDDFESHLSDTLIAGDGLCDATVAREIISEGPPRIQELIQMGVSFSQEKDGSIALGREGGHSQRRILHVKDMTGKAIEEALLHAISLRNNITLFEYHFAIDLILEKEVGKATQEKRVIGLYVFNRKTRLVETFTTNAVLLATGGCGQVYQFTTNPDIANGDGIAMAYRAGATISNMEFIQFHPTSLYSTKKDRFLISEAVRGEGAVLRNMEKHAFMHDYDSRGDLAPRDIVARAIDSEMKKSGAPHVWLDITHIPEKEIISRFPKIYENCLAAGINIAKEYIPVVPAAHYLCGGVVCNLDAETEIPGLYVCGEVACTGLHGANRLASNSLLEAVVMAHRGADSLEKYLQQIPQETPPLPKWVDGNVTDSDERVILTHNWEEMQRTMWDYVGIVRTTKRLQRAQSRLKHLQEEIHEYYWNFKVEPRLLELRNMICVAELIVNCALQRKESRGLHFTLDYPNHLPEAKNSFVFKG